MPSFSHDGKATTVVFGTMRDICELQELHSTTNIVFAFDHGIPKRLSLYPNYKSNRIGKVVSEEDKQIKSAIKEQIDLLRTDYLPSLGFSNVLFENGYEADDIIASLCHTIPKNKDSTCIIVSTDKDLYQLLRQDAVSMYDPRNKRSTTEDSFKKEWKISPNWWWRAKSIAGCNTDGIDGVSGVAEKTACKYLAGKLSITSKAYANISNNEKLILDNEKLVKLPFPGTPEFTLKKDEVTIKKWNELTTKLGMRSLLNHCPLSCLDAHKEQKQEAKSGRFF